MPKTPASGPQYNYVLLSDVHLGADLVQHLRPWTAGRLREVLRIDRELSSMLDHYRTHAEPERPWCVVIAGDLVDFVGMSIASADTGVAVNEEEAFHGLGGNRAHARLKMNAVVARHSVVFDSLAAFVAEGHALALVRGNHDVDFHFETAQQAFLDALLTRSRLGQEDASGREAFARRVQFHPWFYHEEGVLYVEHGHQFDPMCSYHHQLLPVRPDDAERISWSFSDILLRSVVRPTKLLPTEGHEQFGIMTYIRIVLLMELSGVWGLAVRYFRAVWRALGRWRSHASHGAQWLHHEQEKRMQELSSRTQLGVEKLRALAALWPTPVSRGPLDVLRGVLVDQLLVGIFAPLLIALSLVLLPLRWSLLASTVMAFLALLYFRWSSKSRRPDLDPATSMRRGAQRIAMLLGTPFVIMGHTHKPGMEELETGSTYVNLGFWGVDDPENSDTRPPQTHLVLRWVDGRPQAQFLHWCSERGLEPVTAAESSPRA